MYRAENNPAAWGFKHIDDHHSHFTLILRSDLKVYIVLPILFVCTDNICIVLCTVKSST